MMIRTCRIALAAGLVASHSMIAVGQVQTPPPLTCAEALSAPTRDSVVLKAMLLVHAFDRDRDLPSSMQFDFGEALQRHLIVPRPLGLDVYEMSGDTAAPRTARLTIRGGYAATLTAGGRVVDVSTIGGARNVDFDSAVLVALRAIDSTDHIAPGDAGLPKEDIRIRLEIAARDTVAKTGIVPLDRVLVTSISGVFLRPDAIPQPGPLPPVVPTAPDSATAIPLFGFRVPVRRVTIPVRQIPGSGNLRYPDAERRRGAAGQVDVSLVIDADGLAEPESVQIVNATRRDFAKSVLDAMPNSRYGPLVVNGCQVRVYVEQPFQFYVSK